MTDFGSRDHYVGVMKGVILGINPKARIVDLCHDVPPQDIRTAAFQLMASVGYFPKGSLFVCVVDPGVGSTRRILWAKSARHQFLFPDNGLIGWAAEKEPLKECREVSNKKLFPPLVSSTFHGRDIFAPVAARLSRGFDSSKVGPKAADPKRLPFPRVLETAQGFRGEILVLDRFGNAITNVKAAAAGRGSRVVFKGTDLGMLRSHYGEVEPGTALPLAGSSSFIEFSIRGGDFARSFDARAGDPCSIVRKK